MNSVCSIEQPRRVKVLFAPDWTSGNAYQSLLASALGECGIDVVFPRLTRALCPLTEMVSQTGAEILHVHWPEAWLAMGRAGWLRCQRFNMDLFRVLRRIPVVYTAHNTLPHNVSAASCVRQCFRHVLRHSKATFVHSLEACGVLEREFGLAELPFRMVPHGDLSVPLGRPFSAALAREVLELPDSPLILMFGVVEPYKGIEEVIGSWNAAACGATLAICGRPVSREYGQSVQKQANTRDGVICRLGWMSDLEVRLWISACQGVVFNYRQILTSGAAALVRAFGCPVILPERLSTIELGEPDSRVLRFGDLAGELAACVRHAIRIGSDYDSAASWRSQTSWERVAEVTAAVYRDVLLGGQENSRVCETAARSQP